LDRRERFFRAIERKPIDFLPVQVDFSPKALDNITKKWGLKNREEELLELFGNHIVYAYLDDVYGHTKRRELFAQNIVYDEWGVGWDIKQEGTFLSSHPLANIDVYKKYIFPDPDNENLLDSAREKVNLYSNKYIICSYQVLCLFERAWALRGLENFMIDMITNKVFVEELLDRITEFQIRIAERYVALGVDCGRTGDDYGSQNGMMFSPELWREIFKPRLERIWEVYKRVGIPVMHHSCGDVRPIIPDFIEMGLDILNPIQPEAMPIEELACYSRNLTFYGGLSMQKVLPFGTPDEVKSELRRAIKILGKNHGYIIAPSNTITSDVPLENIKALLEGLKEYNN